MASAPKARSRSSFWGDVKVPITAWPRSINWGTSRVPIAPLAPATKTRTGIPFPRSAGWSHRSCARSHWYRRLGTEDVTDGQGPQWLADRFEGQHGNLGAVAYRMLGSLPKPTTPSKTPGCGSANQGRTGQNLSAWFTAVVGRICLDVLRSRDLRREDPFGSTYRTRRGPGRELRPQEEALLAKAVGLALLVVLDTLAPTEGLAVVLHDVSGSHSRRSAPWWSDPRGGEATASRARRRMKAPDVAAPDPDLARQRRVVDAFFLAARGGFGRPRRHARPRRRAAHRRRRRQPAASIVLHGAAAVGEQARIGLRQCSHARRSPATRAGQWSSRSGRQPWASGPSP